MKPVMRFGFLLISIVFISVAAHAQSRLQFSAGYDVNIPSGAFRDFISNNAYKGFNAGLAYRISDQFDVGLDVRYNDYYQKYPRDVYSLGKGSDISAVISNSVQLLPVTIKANYIFTKQGFIRPYIAAGGGVNFISYAQYLGEFGDTKSYVKPTVTGDAGILIPFKRYNPSTALELGGGYNYTPFNYNGFKDMDTWNIHLGVKIPLH